MEITPTSLVITLSLFTKTIYKQLILTAVYRTNLLATDPNLLATDPNLLATDPNLHLTPALYLINTTYKNKAITDVL